MTNPTGAEPSGLMSNQAAVQAARIELLTHRLDPNQAACAGCGKPSPCPTANQAAAVIVAAGAWNTLPFNRSRDPGNNLKRPPTTASPIVRLALANAKPSASIC